MAAESGSTVEGSWERPTVFYNKKVKYLIYGLILLLLAYLLNVGSATPSCGIESSVSNSSVLLPRGTHSVATGTRSFTASSSRS